MPTLTWAASGLLFENCSCQLLCPAHVSFKNTCDHDRCRGYWGIHIAEGHYGDVTLNDLNLVIVYDAPVRMYSGDWQEMFYVDERATGAQRQALEAIFSGQAGGLGRRWRVSCPRGFPPDSSRSGLKMTGGRNDSASRRCLKPGSPRSAEAMAKGTPCCRISTT